MNRYTATFLGAMIVAACAWTFLAQPAIAEDKYLTLEEAGKLGMKVILTEPKPKVIFITLNFTDVPQEAELVVCDGNRNWIAHTKVKISDKVCTASLNEEYVSKSYFRVTQKLGGLTYIVPLR